MHKESNDHQAKKLQQLFAEVNNQELAGKKTKAIEEENFVEVDVLQLPPRSEVHQKSRWSPTIYWRSPLFRFSLVVVILVALILVAYLMYGDDMMHFFHLSGWNK